jgi:putative peptidoglycan lipid II flippase
VTPEKTEQDQKNAPSMAKTFGTVAVLTVLSKVIGLARDVVVAAAYGTSVIADAYNYAYMFTGNVLILFGGLGGPFHSSTVAIIEPQKNNPEIGKLLLQIIAITIAILSAITLIALIFAWPLAQLMAQNYDPTVPNLAHTQAGQAAMAAANALLLPDKKLLFAEQFKQQLIIMLPLIVISGVVGVSYGVLNVYNKIFWPSLSPAIASIAIIAAIWLSNPEYRLLVGIPLAVGTLAGAIGQMLAQFPGMFSLPLIWHRTLQAQPGLTEYRKMLWPAVFSTSIGQLTVYVDGGFAFMTNQQGAWTAIVTSNRLVQLPLGILLTAMLVPILPRFTQLVNADKPESLKSELRRSLNFLWFASLPMTAILFVIARPIVEVLFQRGNFDSQSTSIVTLALLFLAPSIVFYVARDLVTRVFYAYKDSSTPYRVALAAIILKAALDWMLLQMMNRSIAAISLASTIITIFNLSLLTWALKSKIGNLGMTKMVKPLTIMLAAGALCGAVTGGTYYGLASLIPIHVWFAQLGLVAISSLLGMVVYTVFCLAFRLEEPLMVARRIPLLRNYVPRETEQKSE